VAAGLAHAVLIEPIGIDAQRLGALAAHHRRTNWPTRNDHLFLCASEHGRWFRLVGLNLFDLTRLVAHANLDGHVATAQDAIDRHGHILAHRHAVPVLDLQDDIEGGRSFALENGLLRSAPSRLFVAQGHRLDATYQVA